MEAPYQPVPQFPDFPAMERRLLGYWKEIDAFGQLRKKNEGKPRWRFLDGPITANNPMGVHHAWGRSYKDMFQRYHAMCGKSLRYQNGFDCQGLWVEVEVEKELGFETKADIVRHGMDAFVRACKERVLTFAARQTEQSVRLGYWTDWDDPQTLLALRDALRADEEQVTITTPSGESVTGSPEALISRLGNSGWGGSYFTFTSENNYTIWSFLKKCHDEGFVYRGTDVMPWCCRCGTGLSQMELVEGRKIVRHTSVFVRFPLKGREQEALLVWTTTPWTLTSNVAAAVNPEMTYLRVRHGEWTYYLGKGNFKGVRLQDLEAGGKKEKVKLHTLEAILKGSGELEVLGELPGSELVGLTYEGPFDHLPAQQTPGGVSPLPTDPAGPTAASCHRVVAWSEVSEGEGTGIVHIAPGCGAEDHRLGGEEGLVAVAPLTDGGEYVEGFGELTGQHVLKVTDRIVQDLRARGVLVAKEAYPHVYPHCWRCKSELVFRLVDEWFIRMSWRDRIQKIVPDVRWIPADGEAREQDWLMNMGDWMISKKRFWGLALPIWYCEPCDAFEVIGGGEELKERAVEGWEAFEGHTPHRPWIDLVKIACPGCGQAISRVEDVGNPWLDAGIVPFSTNHFTTDPEFWRQWFPADFVVECFPGQFRNWFYALLAMSAMVDGRAPFSVLLGHALVRDARGEEMHKTAGNSIAFDEAAEVLGAEVMRYLYASQRPTANLSFPDLPKAGAKKKQKGIDDEVRGRLLTLWNCYKFFVTYASVDGWTPSSPVPLAERSELDRWVISRLQRLIGEAHAGFSEFAIYRFVHEFEAFSEEFSNWYLRRSRRRFWRADTDADKQAAYSTLHEVLTTLTRLLAPVLPFLTEELFQNLVRSVDPSAPQSVHLLDYPAADPGKVDPELEARVDCVIRHKNLGHNLRNQAKLKVRQPLARLIVVPRDERDRDILSDPHFAEQILDECNIKSLELIEDKAALGITESLRPNFKVLGPRYGKHIKAIGQHLAQADPSAVQAALASGYSFEAGGEAITLGPGDVDVRQRGPDALAFLSDHGSFAALDTELTPALKSEGLRNDFNRPIQEQRKALDLNVSDRIDVVFAGADPVVQAVEAHRAWLCQELLADSIERADSVEGGVAVKVGEHAVTVKVTKV